MVDALVIPPDAPVDAVRVIDADPSLVTMTVYDLQSGTPVNGAFVHFESADGSTKIEKVTGADGVASADLGTTGGGTVTAAEPGAVTALGTSYVLGTILDVQPGDNLTFGTPEPASTSISFTVNITPFDQVSPMTVISRCGTANVAAGATTATITGTCSASPFGIIAVIRDDNQQILQWTSLPAEIPMTGSTYTLPTTWTAASTETFNLAGLPPDADTVNVQYNAFSEDVMLDQEQAQVALAGDGTGSAALPYAPLSGREFTEIQLLDTATSAAQLWIQVQFGATETHDFSVQELPWITDIAMDTTARSLSWTEGAIEGSSTRNVEARVLSTNYSIMNNDVATSMQWTVTSPPGTPVFAWPSIPMPLAALDVSSSAMLTSASVNLLGTSAESPYAVLHTTLLSSSQRADGVLDFAGAGALISTASTQSF